MTPDAYRILLDRLGLSINEAGAWLAGDPRTGRRWAEQGPPHSVATLLMLMAAMDLRREDVESEIGRWERRAGRPE